MARINRNKELISRVAWADGENISKDESYNNVISKALELRYE
jgi:hypothetical protein